MGVGLFIGAAIAVADSLSPAGFVVGDPSRPPGADAVNAADNTETVHTPGGWMLIAGEFQRVLPASHSYRPPLVVRDGSDYLVIWEQSDRWVVVSRLDAALDERARRRFLRPENSRGILMPRGSASRPTGVWRTETTLGIDYHDRYRLELDPDSFHRWPGGPYRVLHARMGSPTPLALVFVSLLSLMSIAGTASAWQQWRRFRAAQRDATLLDLHFSKGRWSATGRSCLVEPNRERAMHSPRVFVGVAIMESEPTSGDTPGYRNAPGGRVVKFYPGPRNEVRTRLSARLGRAVTIVVWMHALGTGLMALVLRLA